MHICSDSFQEVTNTIRLLVHIIDVGWDGTSTGTLVTVDTPTKMKLSVLDNVNLRIPLMPNLLVIFFYTTEDVKFAVVSLSRHTAFQ